MKAWTVRRTWWELTKLVLAGRGGYALYLRVGGLPDKAQDAFDRESWVPTQIDWVGGCDRFVNLTAEAEQ